MSYGGPFESQGSYSGDQYFYEGEATNIISTFVLDNRDNPNKGQNIVILYSGLLFDWEKPVLGSEIVIRGIKYQVTGITPPSNPGNPNTNTYYVKEFPDPRIPRNKESKFMDHSFLQFTDI